MYNARGSLAESKDYWLDLLFERQKVSKGLYQHYKTIAEKTSIKLQNYISSLYRSKENHKYQ